MRSSLVFALLAVILVPAGALALLGLRTFHGESERVRSELRERAQQAADTVRRALTAEVTSLARGEGGALPLRFDADGRLLEPTLTREWPDAPSGPEDAALLRFLEAEVDRLEREGGVERLASRLSEVGLRQESPWMAAWAWSTLGAVEHRAGRSPEARAAWGELIRRHPGVRDERGLVRAFVARRFLAQDAPDSEAASLALFADVVTDHVAESEHATAAFKESLRAELEETGGADLLEILAQDRERDRVRRLRRDWREGIGEWFTRGAPGGTARFSGWIVSGEPAPDDGTPAGRGGAIELARLVGAALVRPEVVTLGTLGFRPIVRGAGLGDPALPDAVPLAERDLAAPFSGLTLSVVADDMPGLLEAEQRGFRLMAGLVVLVILFSLGAGLATVRAIGREVEAARGRDAFMAAVTHELKSPLASIRLLGEVLGQGDVEEEKVREFGQRTAAEAERLTGVITSVLALARLEHEGGTPEGHVSLDLRGVVSEARETFVSLAPGGNVEVVLRLPEEAVPVRADATTLSSALLNLLDNARKYADEPHPIEVELEADGERIRLSVLDRGRGVAAADAERIFEPFRRVGDEMTRDRPGVGLGLALVRRIAEAHGGTATCRPREGGGSRFTLELPMERARA